MIVWLHASVVEWSITTDCKSVAFGLRRFESFPAHIHAKIPIKYLMGIFACMCAGESDLRHFREGFENLEYIFENVIIRENTRGVQNL